jgi:hypothetical protein
MSWGKRWGIEDLRGVQARSKFGAVRTEAPASYGGTRTADSKTGAALAQALALQQQLGQIKGWAEEVSIPVGPDEKGRIVRYRADALVVVDHITLPDGAPAMIVRLLDAKRGVHDTDLSRAKRAALRQRGIEVQVVNP